ncbi:hypothetical protein A2810_01440 [candidate division Kazan bacterium RIFCSPHIGHO2_01_FULL_49_10]|uniref:Thioredoxin domain-containing protein n=1 Tax=candidate division Kazan bacterium RIFCSPLOWO2_01_FULL_48_13 TaxID=1798539 RepID=A0A1F4PPM4_UNCK3|nr:MAG: hypothetical protein A2810_01440 [candidate division Kazan bacterium RIFCSPHIGHO2_01_FULL_49_10]OGB85604.1 MAG: hypothetical protein A2994_01120 [candidate division Kazan bacterium RIFCSPLOWO2_01_FULL_48_13]
MNQIKFWPIAMLMLVTLMGAGCAAAKPPANNAAPVSDFPSAKIESLAKALTAAGVKMYGSEFCSACKYQKQMFADAWKFVTYVNCDVSVNSGVQNAACRAENIKLYPTWEFKDSSRLEGVQKFEVLAEKIGFDL